MIGIAGLLLATLAFVGSHFLLSHPLRRRLMGQLGEAGFQGVYSIVAILTLLWVILAYEGLDGVPLWIAPGWWWPVAAALMLVACILLVGSLFKNPAFPHPGAGKRPVRAATGVFAITRHPMNWAFALWALVHLSLWWSPRNLIVAGGILVLALGGSVGQDRKKRAAQGQSWRQWEARTSFVPFQALAQGRAQWRAAAPDWRVALGGLALWLAVTSFHAPTVSPLVWAWQSFG
ncbi:MAG TPA: NnrU family protein [Allosphingosinicella sp.]